MMDGQDSPREARPPETDLSRIEWVPWSELEADPRFIAEMARVAEERAAGRFTRFKSRHELYGHPEPRITCPLCSDG